jgi:hypothetical protein
MDELEPKKNAFGVVIMFRVEGEPKKKNKTETQTSFSRIG